MSDPIIAPPPKDISEYLSYHPESGEFTWLITTGSRGKVGTVAGNVDAQGYVVIEFRGRRYKAHRLAWWFRFGAWPREFIDHVDGDKSNNSLSNLREATRSQNMMNRPAYGVGRLKGASYCKITKKYVARIRCDGKRYSLGYFPTAEEAHAAYMDVAFRLHGEFARVE